MDTSDLDLDDLSSAEDFLDYFGVKYDPAAVQVHRLHILQRFHDYLAQSTEVENDTDRHELYRDLLHTAYQDFLVSDARREKVFRVFQRQASLFVSVPLAQTMRDS